MEGGAFSVLGALDAACLEQKNGCEEVRGNAVSRLDPAGPNPCPNSNPPPAPTPTSTPVLSLSPILTLGALDASCLCCACAGVCAAVAARPTSAEEGSACRRALAINIWFGDFVEAHSTPVLGGRAAASTTRPRHLLGVPAQACYPYMARDGYVRAAALCGARAAKEP